MSSRYDFIRDPIANSSTIREALNMVCTLATDLQNLAGHEAHEKQHGSKTNKAKRELSALEVDEGNDRDYLRWERHEMHRDESAKRRERKAELKLVADLVKFVGVRLD
tara:strand:- start:143 stop:466 length:324 start_codon:yes stop_codon:yes gene_type:complete